MSDTRIVTRESLLARLRAIHENEVHRVIDGNYSNSGPDEEVTHAEADDMLIAYINDPEIAEAYAAIGKWYA